MLDCNGLFQVDQSGAGREIRLAEEFVNRHRVGRGVGHIVPSCYQLFHTGSLDQVLLYGGWVEKGLLKTLTVRKRQPHRFDQDVQVLRSIMLQLQNIDPALSLERLNNA